MSEITKLFVEADEGEIDFEASTSEPDLNRPPQIQMVAARDVDFFCYEGQDGSRTFYGRQKGTIYSPLDAVANELTDSNPSFESPASVIKVGHLVKILYIAREVAFGVCKILNEGCQTERPAWLQVALPDERVGFVECSCPDGQRWFFKKMFDRPNVGRFFVSIDASSVELEAFFDHLAPLWDKNSDLSRELSVFIEEKVRQYCPGRKALDICSGTGMVAEKIADHCERVDLVDVSAAMLKFAGSKPKLANSRLIRANIAGEEIPTNEHYGLVVCCNGLHYLRGNEAEKAVQNIQKMQGPGDFFINAGRANYSLLTRYYKPVECGQIPRRDKNKSQIPYFIGRCR